MSAKVYARAFFLEEIYSADFDSEFSREWIEIEEAIANLRNRYRIFFANLGFFVPEDSVELESDVNFILTSPTFDRDGDDYTGIWVRLNLPEKDTFISRWKAGTDQAVRLATLGDAARAKAATRTAEELGWFAEPEFVAVEEASTSDDFGVPASDRIVTLNHNQPEYTEIAEALNAAIERAEAIRPNDVSGDQHASLVSGLRAAAKLWDAYELVEIQIRVGIILALEQAENQLKITFEAARGGLLVELIKLFLGWGS